MMKSIVEESRATFKELEKKIFAYVCKAAVEMRQIILKAYDRELHTSRNTKEYRDKGCRTTTIKTVYGDIIYDRHVYQTTDKEGCKMYVYFLNEAVRMDRIDLHKSGRKDSILRDGKTVSCDSGYYIWHKRSDNQSWRCMETGTEVGGAWRQMIKRTGMPQKQENCIGI